MRGKGIVPSEKSPVRRPTPVERNAEAYKQYLLEVRALAQPTIINYVPFARDFLEHRFGAAVAKLSPSS